MKKWQKLIREITRTPGPIRVQLFLLTTLTASSVLSTGLQISKAVGNTSVENTSYKNESLEVAKVNGELRLRVTGKNTTEVLQNLKPMLNNLVEKTSSEKSYPSMSPLEK